MKTRLCGSILAIALALAVGEAQAVGMTQRGFGASRRAFSAPNHEVMGNHRSFGGPLSGGRAVAARPMIGTMSWRNHRVAAPRFEANHGFTGRIGGRTHFGGFDHRDFHNFGRGGFDHGGFHHHGNGFIIVYVNGLPCWYPIYYSDYPYYYDYPPAPVYDDSYAADDNSYVPPAVVGSGDTATPDASTVQTTPSYGDLGVAWGQDLRRTIVTWDQFVAYLKAYIITAPPASQAEFREGFVSAYGINSGVAYDKAAAQAAGNPPQPGKIVNVQPNS